MIKTILLILLVCISYLQAETITINGVKATVTASSTLSSKKKGAYSVKNLFDNNSNTAWVEGVKGPGVGESITIEFEKPIEVLAIEIEPGYRKNFKTFHQNALPESIAITVDGSKSSGEFRYIPAHEIKDYVRAISKASMLTKYLFLNKNSSIKKVTLRITSATQENKYDDLAISGIRFITKSDAKSEFIEHLRRVSPTINKNSFTKYPGSAYVSEGSQPTKKGTSECLPYSQWNQWNTWGFKTKSFIKKLIKDPSYSKIFTSPSYGSLKNNLFAYMPVACSPKTILLFSDALYSQIGTPDAKDTYSSYSVSAFMYLTYTTTTDTFSKTKFFIQEADREDYAPYDFLYYPFFLYNKLN